MAAASREGPSPRAAVRRELARAAGDLALLPGRALGYLARRAELRAELEGDLAREPAFYEPGPPPRLPARPLRIFLSCAEASGELHARGLLAALRRRIAAAGAPEPELIGLGGRALAAEGVQLLGSPAERAAMGFDGVLSALPYYLDLVRRSAERFRAFRPDLFLPVDSPALHVPLAQVARSYGIPVAHFVTPQYWGWAPWRVRGYARAVDLALTILPFEPAWFERRGVRVAHVGHPLLDAAEPAAPVEAGARRALVLLPGSRLAVIERNLPWMLALAGRLRSELGGAPLVVALRDEEGAALARRIAGAEGAARIAVGALPTLLTEARAALSVSGTVLLELLRARVPAVAVYRLGGRLTEWLSRRLLTAPWFASVNLLAGREVYPEFCFAGRGPEEAAGAALARCWRDEEWRAACLRGLDDAARRLGPRGACERAAAAALELAGQPLARGAELAAQGAQR